MPLTINQFRETIKKTEVTCALCPFTAHSLVKHLEEKHHLSPGQYKNQFPDKKLNSPIVSELLRRMDRKDFSSDNLSPHVKLFGPDDQLSEIFRSLVEKENYQIPAELKEYVPERDRFYEFDDDAKDILVALHLGKNVFSSGPTGCGKTEEFLQIHAALGKPVRRVNMTGDVTVSNFLGQQQADPLRGTYFDLGILPWCMENGVPLIVDEFDVTPPQIAMVLHPVLERSRKTYVPDAGKVFQAKSGFNILATANTGGKGDNQGAYTGTEIMNSAVLDRFPFKLKKDYLSRDKEVSMLERRFPQVESSLIFKMVSMAIEIRTAFKQGSLSVTYSTRKLIDYFEMTNHLSHKSVIHLTLMNWLDEDDSALVGQILNRVGVET